MRQRNKSRGSGDLEPAVREKGPNPVIDAAVERHPTRLAGRQPFVIRDRSHIWRHAEDGIELGAVLS